MKFWKLAYWAYCVLMFLKLFFWLIPQHWTYYHKGKFYGKPDRIGLILSLQVAWGVWLK